MLIRCSGPFGSHVLEKALTAVASAAKTAVDDVTYDLMERCLGAVTEAVVECLYEMVLSKYGSFVARRLLCLLSGREVASAPKRHQPAFPPQPREATSVADIGAVQVEHAGSNKRKSRNEGLASRVGAVKQTHHTSARVEAACETPPFPELLYQLAEATMSDDWTGSGLAELQTDQFSGPFLQALLRAVGGWDASLSGKLVVHLLGGNASGDVNSITSDDLQRLITDRQGSHLVEAAFEAAPDDVFQKLCTVAFRGRTVPMAQHPVANFVVQAALASVRKPQQLKRMFEDLRPQLATLLKARRGGVVATLLAASLRLQSLESDVSDAVWHAVDSGFAGISPSPLHALLTLDSTVRLGQAGSTGRLSPLGCAMLVTVFSFSDVASSKRWGEALLALDMGELCAVARDPGGCRVIETYLQGPGSSPKKQRRVLQALSGSWAATAATGAGCRFVQKCFIMAEPSNKHAITAELSAAETRIAAVHGGTALLRLCRVDAFRIESPDEWTKRAAAAESTKREFEELFASRSDHPTQDRDAYGKQEVIAEGAEPHILAAEVSPEAVHTTKEAKGKPPGRKKQKGVLGSLERTVDNEHEQGEACGSGR
jgi:nucleolar protein 9